MSCTSKFYQRPYCGRFHILGDIFMENSFNFVERFAPLSSLQMTVVELDDGRFVLAPENLISCNIQPDHAVVWYQNEGRTIPGSPNWASSSITGRLPRPCYPSTCPGAPSAPPTSWRCLRWHQSRFWWPTPPGPGTLTPTGTRPLGRRGRGSTASGESCAPDKFFGSALAGVLLPAYSCALLRALST